MQTKGKQDKKKRETRYKQKRDKIYVFRLIFIWFESAQSNIWNGASLWRTVDTRSLKEMLFPNGHSSPGTSSGHPQFFEWNVIPKWSLLAGGGPRIPKTFEGNQRRATRRSKTETRGSQRGRQDKEKGDKRPTRG